MGLPALLGPPCRARDLALALILARAVLPASKLATVAWWPDTTLGPDLDVGGVHTDEVYAAMDWLLEPPRRDRKASLPQNICGPKVNPSRMALFDLTSSWVTGRCCELAARGYSRDGKKGCEQIEYGMLTDPDGPPGRGAGVRRQHRRPGRVHRDRPAVRDTFGLENLVLVGDRGMITSARIAALRELNDDPAPQRISAGSPRCAPRRSPNSPPMTGRCRCRLFDQQDLAEISPPRLPRRTADRLPQPRCWPPNAPANATSCSPPPRRPLAPIVARVAAGPACRRRRDRCSGSAR